MCYWICSLEAMKVVVKAFPSHCPPPMNSNGHQLTGDKKSLSHQGYIHISLDIAATCNWIGLSTWENAVANYHINRAVAQYLRIMGMMSK